MHTHPPRATREDENTVAPEPDAMQLNAAISRCSESRDKGAKEQRGKRTFNRTIDEIYDAGTQRCNTIER